MTRIPDSQLDRLKRDLPLLVRLVEASGVELRGDGDNLIGRCCLHSDRTPSFVISRKKVLWHCMGACQAGGTAIDFLMKRDGLSFVRAVKALRDFAGAEPDASSSAPADPAPELHAERTAEELAVLDEVARYYTERLHNSPRALAYLERRGLVAPGLIERFRIGFADQSLVRVLPPKTTPEGEAKRALLERLGILNQGYEHFAASVVFPIMNDDGQIVGMYGRRISPPSRGKSPHRYLPGPHRAVFNGRSLALGEETIVCEAIIDALTLISAGIENVISAYGVEGFTPEHFAALEHHHIQRTLIAYDRDPAGDRAALELAEKLKARGIAAYRVELPKGMDVNEYAAKLKPAEKSLPIVLRKAVPMDDAPPRLAPPELISEPVSKEIPSTPPVPSLAAPEPPAATSLAASFFAPPPDVVMHEEGEELFLSIEDRVYRVRGLSKNSSLGSMKVNLSITRGDAYFIDTLDLCQLRPRQQLERSAAAELSLSEERMHRDLGKVLRKLEEVQRDRVRALMTPKTIVPEMAPEDRAAAMALLQDPKLFDRILSDFARAGVVGEEGNKLIAYLVAVSRKLDEPLAVIVQSSSAAGKSSLVEAVLAFMPEEDCLKYSAMTGQSLYYMTTRSLEHKILSIAEEEGASRASYALKLLLSERRLIMAAPTKDDSGVIQTKDYLVEGPVAGFLTTTSYDVDEELQNRCIVLAVDESRAQTEAIHVAQRRRETLDGLIQRREKMKILRLHHNAQRLLRSLHVANPRAEALTFRDLSTRSRRDHPKYLGLIRAVALLRQHQKEVKTVETELGEILEYIEVEVADIEIADRLAREVLEQSAAELPAQTARLLHEITTLVKKRAAETKTTPTEVRFTRREIREATGMGNTRLKVHMKRLEDLEHVALRGGRGYRFEYQLVVGASVETPKWSPPEATWSPPRAEMGAPEIPSGRPRSPHGRPPEDRDKHLADEAQSPTWSPLEPSRRNGAAHHAKLGALR